MHKLDLSQSTPASKQPESTATVASATSPSTAKPIATKTTVDPKASITDNQASTPLVRPLSTEKSMAKSSKIGFIVAAIVAIAAGVGTGYGSFKLYAKTAGVPTQRIEQVATGDVKVGDTFGSNDVVAFKDPATGYLEAGGLDGEGTHKLLRPGGPSQTVYLTSSVTDLSKVEGMEVKIWGETFKGQKAGWLMDVGRVEVLKVQGEIPTE